MNYDNIIICLEQKNLFITNIVNFTKQLEIKAQQDDVDFEDILLKRQDAMQRIDKCNQLINKELEETSVDEANIIKAIIKEPGSSNNDEYAKIKELSLIYIELLSCANELDKKAMSLVSEKYNAIKSILNGTKKSTANMFKL